MTSRHRWLLTLVALACCAAGLAGAGRAQGATCQMVAVTGYSSAQFGGTTATGERTHGNEWQIVAVDHRSPRVPLGGSVWLDGIGTLRAADTGYLAVAGVDFDVLVFSAAEAFSLTGQRQGCW